MIREFIIEFKNESHFFNFFGKLKSRLIISLWILVFIFLFLFYFYNYIFAIIFLFFSLAISFLTNVIILSKKLFGKFNMTLSKFSNLMHRNDHDLFIDKITKYKLQNSIDLINEYIKKELIRFKKKRMSPYTTSIIGLLISTAGSLITYFVSNSPIYAIIFLFIIIMIILGIRMISLDFTFLFSRDEDYVDFLEDIEYQIIEAKSYYIINRSKQLT